MFRVQHSITRTLSPLLFLTTALIAPHVVYAQSGSTLYTVSGAGVGFGDDKLRTIDPLTAQTLTEVPINAGVTIDHMTGLAVHPVTQTVYAVADDGSGASRFLIRFVELDTGLAEVIGSLGDSFSSIAFDEQGTLYGIVGFGGISADTLHTISTSDASTSFVQALNNPCGGETIAFHDGTFYHMAGSEFACPPTLEATTDPTLPPTSIALGTVIPGWETTSMVFYPDMDAFFATAWDFTALIDPSGAVTPGPTADHFIKGVVFVGPAPNRFVRGDANDDSSFDISDAIFTLDVLFGSGPTVPCQRALDSNDDGNTDISDVIFTLAALFTPSAPSIPPPHPDCGADPTPDLLTCDAYTHCP